MRWNASEILKAFLAERLQIALFRISVSNLTTLPVSLHKKSVSYALDQAKVTIHNKETESSALEPILTLSKIEFELQKAQKSVISRLGIFDSFERINAEPICGNRICELGERPVLYLHENETSEWNKGENEDTISMVFAVSLGCPEDCLFAYHVCPIGSVVDGEQPTPCSSRGVCHSATGHCTCWPGYVGNACSECDTYYTRFEFL